MTIGIIFILDLEYAPYIKKYINEIKKNGKDFEILYWNRLNGKYNEDWKTIPYNKAGNLNDSKIQKLKGFLGFRKFLINKLSEKKYDKLIILTTLTGLLISDYLIKNYKNKYIFDIRDYSFEHIKLFKYIENKLIENSYFTSISSEGFKNFLPNSNKYVISHNILDEEVHEALQQNKKEKNDLNKINLTFIGAVRHFEIDKLVINTFSNDKIFNLYFHGYGASYDKLKKYTEKNFRNVELTGKYNRKEKPKLLENTNIINSYYSENEIMNQYALPNKYYDAIIYRIPLWANPKVYVGQRAISKGIGLNVPLDENTRDQMLKEYSKIDWNKFYEDCAKELENILTEDQIFWRKLAGFLEC